MLRMEDIPGEAFWYSACERGGYKQKKFRGQVVSPQRPGCFIRKLAGLVSRELSDDGEIRSYKQG